jgi:hypothetical protein
MIIRILMILHECNILITIVYPIWVSMRRECHFLRTPKSGLRVCSIQ